MPLPSMDDLRPRTDEAVLAANDWFYQALEAGDMDAMVDIWAHGDEVSCAHPGRMPLRGWADVRESWRMILVGGGNPQVITTEVHLTRSNDTAWVSLSENLLAGEHAGVATAINIFRHDGDRWRLVVHHAAPVFASG